MNKQLISVLSAVMLLSACADNSAPDSNNEMSNNMNSEAMPPVAKKIPHEMEIHGHTRIDDYYWMRDDERKDPEMLAHLEAENKYLKSVMKHTEDFQKKLYDEIVGRIKKDDSSVPVKRRGFWYQSQFDGSSEYPVHVRWLDGTEAQEILFDENKMAEGHGYFRLGAYSVSENNMMAAFSTDTVSRRQYTIQIKDLNSGEILSDKIVNTEGSPVWANDNQHIFYISKDPQTLLGNEVYRHKIGTDQSEDVLMYREDDETYYTYLSKSRDGSVIYIHHSSTTTTGVSILSADDPMGSFEPFLPLEDNLEYAVEKLRDTYYIYTNWDANNFRIMSVSKDKTSDKSAWQDVVAHREDVFLQDLSAFDDALVIKEKENGVIRMRVLTLSTGESKNLSFDDPVFSANISNNPEVSSEVVRIGYSSMTTPSSVYEFNLKSGERALLKQDEVLGGFKAENYQSERIFVEARDGKQVPVSIVYRKDMYNADGTNPLFQYAYGSYGATIDPSFSGPRLSLLDRGVVYAIAHIRGSQMLGRPWYEDGKLYNKKNSFYDFIDVTKGLTALKYGHPEKIYAMGGSAGGLLMGGVLNMAPELYLGVGAHVPFVDVVTTMLDESIPLTTGEWDEWGKPAQKGYYDYMLSYSPYDQVERKDYPNILVTTGLWDSQVQYFEPMKWVAKLRDYKTDDNLLVFETDMEAGHGGASGRFKRYKQTALEYAFFFDLLGITE
ncbi:S9 family peptidase [Pseudemcibacter aquimaris]|uniref:S9 family peptidase n=1 Tax=Pseudemcibacter aquimaris TaxID=2857064 RepID=UPI002011F4A7|nr:S9 family peptidase [Pseudemcibacter aquimaris]MCC3861977.1 S9 family peptidase [Pseudemcibacter aquimaris]WDU58729.1 S9 family peptidase [Pseudemcibacter aquimaris]